jgi:hypothetical protein
MDDDTKESLVAGINLLIRSPNAHALFETMQNAAPLIGRHKAVTLTGEAEPLNALALFKTGNPDKYEAIIDLIERKRAEAGSDPLRKAADDRFDRNEYMQQFMVQKRLRERRAVDIENMLRDPRDKLIGRSRLDFMQRKAAEWKLERDRLIAVAKDARKGRLTREDTTMVLAQFWGKVDDQLDLLEDAARKELQKPSSSRNRSLASMTELTQILKHDPYK